MTAKLSFLLLVLGFMFPVLTQSADISQYRVTGFITLDDNKNIALVEKDGYQFQMLRVGDDFGGGVITQITRKWMLIDDGKQAFRIWIVGKRGTLTAVAPDDSFRPQNAPNILADKSNAGKVVVNAHVNSHALLDEISAQKLGENIEDVYAFLHSVLDLPKNAEITQINHTPLSSTEAIELINHSLISGSVISLSINGLPGKESIYIFPSDYN
ncbi:MAG TPA: hypothetical protein ENJ28_02505 [Gammaproteobacteria bacterium]|nr:hypothetical protein [Gammaproteobacteria bacterium]